MNDVWGNDEDYARKAAAKHRRKKAKRARRRARHAAKGSGCLLALAVSCGLWAALLVPLILWGPL